ncbi:MAG TPA: hypothetical protein VFG14_06155 [Chthoniobacteraceae bacterium]|nr:hypothetical protein [Chthoniobacteraceae bacterium]
MNRRLIPALLLLGSLSFGQPEKSDDEVAARKNALELAGAFANDGFKLRDGHWSGSIKTGEGKLVQVNLYAGNEYYFAVASTEKAKKVALSVFDETGAAITIEEPYQEGFTAAVGFSPVASGPYYIKVEELEGEATAFCLICSYK